VNVDFEAQLDDVRRRLQAGLERERADRRGGAAVVIPLLPGEEGMQVLFQVRAYDLPRQPGEVCFPGGHIEQGEDPLDAAVRETCEELALESSQVRIVADLGQVVGPGGMPLWLYVGTISDYRGTFDPEEVDHVFTMPLAWFQDHAPHVYVGSYIPELPDDFPWSLVPNGRDYAWRHVRNEVFFYFGTEPLIWGFTARMMCRLADLLR